MNRSLLDAADLLDRVGGEAVAHGLDLRSALALVDVMIGSTYTMAREREVHGEIVGSAPTSLNVRSVYDNIDELVFSVEASAEPAVFRKLTLVGWTFLIVGFYGEVFSREWKGVLWDRYATGALR